MNTKNLLLGIFVILTVVFASLTLNEYYQVNALSSRLQLMTTTATSTTTVTSTLSCPSKTTCGSFIYAPTGQVQVDSVQATEYICHTCGAVNGESYITFAVTFENIGNSTIYIDAGSDSLTSSVPTNSSVIQYVTSSVECSGSLRTMDLSHGQNYTMYAPGCRTGFDYQVVQAGSVNVRFWFEWTTNSTAANSFGFSNPTTISAQLVFP
jgi:hypothetical protein